MFQSSRKIAVRASVTDQRPQVRSSYQMSPFGMGGGNVNMQMGYTGLGAIKDGMLDGVIPSDPRQLFDIYTDIYYHDPIAGAAVDLMSTLPFSDWTLSGADERQLEVFESNLDRLNMRSLMPEMSVDYLVLGTFVSTLVFKKAEKLFTDLIPQNIADCTVIPTPLYGTDPLIKMKIGADMKEFINSREPHIERLKERLSPGMLRAMRAPEVTLDPLTTLYVPRRSFTFNNRGTSLYHRLLPIYFLEKILYRGTLTEAAKRQRSILHIVAGDEDWEPTDEELKAIVALFQQADLDPVGAMIATRDDVNTNEIRSGGDSWKWTDTIPETSNLKMQALGINEGFLCLAEGSYVHTERGLIPIDQLYDRRGLRKDQGYTTDLLVKGRSGEFAKAIHWWYRGKSPVVKTTTQSGYNVTTTKKHEVLTLGQDLRPEWVPVKRLQKSDYLCIDTQGQEATEPLRLNLTDYLVKGGWSQKAATKPTEMTPDLAYVLGLIVSEGTLKKKNVVSITNSNLGVLDRYQEAFTSVFGVVPERTLSSPKGRRYNIKGVTGTSNSDVYKMSFEEVKVVHWLKELGVVQKRKSEVNNPSAYRVVPWSILQAPTECRLAFIAAFLDGDGSVAQRKDTVALRFCSSSGQLLDQMQILLADLGVPSFRMTDHPKWLSVIRYFGNKFYRRLRPWLAHTEKNQYDVREADLQGRTFGVPIPPIRNFLASRWIRRETNVGEWFENAEGQPVLIEGFGHRTSKYLGSTVGKGKHRDGVLPYSNFEKGLYSDLLDILEQIDPVVVRRLVRLSELQYFFDPVQEVKPAGTSHLYDLTMEHKVAPAFVSNGIVVHNSGDMSYGTMEVALSVFIEHMRAFRDMTTHRVFYNKLFPLISVINGFEKEEDAPKPNPYYRHRTPEESAARRTTPMLTTDMVQWYTADTSKLVIPTMHWHKALRPEADTEYLTVLETLTEKGVPVPLRMWAAAGGLSVDSLMSDLEEDAEIKDRIKELKGGGDDEDDDDFSFSGLRSIKRQTLTDRDFGDLAELSTTDKAGKKRHVFNQTRANKAINDKIIKAVREIAKEPNNKRRQRMAQRFIGRRNPYGDVS